MGDVCCKNLGPVDGTQYLTMDFVRKRDLCPIAILLKAGRTLLVLTAFYVTELQVLQRVEECRCLDVSPLKDTCWVGGTNSNLCTFWAVIQLKTIFLSDLQTL